MKKLIAVFAIVAALSASAAMFVACENAKPTGEHEHTYVEEITKAATCTEKGVKTLTCSGCNDVKTEEIAALGHDYDEGTVSKAPTCTEAGTFVKTCKRCDATVEEEIEALGHDFSVEKEIIPATCTDDEKAVMKCSRCEETRTVVKEGGQEKLGHDYKEVEGSMTEPSCTEEGGATYACSRCDDSYSEVIPALGHLDDQTKAEVTAPTCETEGYTTRHCGRCGEDYKTDNVQPLGHEYEKNSAVEATCDTVGYDLYECKNGCGRAEYRNVVKNIAHEFEGGVCKTCHKTAEKAFVLSAEKATYMTLDDKGVYKVYAPTFTQGVYYIPYNVLDELRKDGIYSFELGVGSNDAVEPRSFGLTINDGTESYLNAGASEIKAFKTIVFATADGVNDDIDKDKGLKIQVYYRAMDYPDEATGKDKVDNFCIKFTYIRQFDAADSRSWIITSADYSYDAVSGIYTLGNINTSGANGILIRPEWIKSFYDKGYNEIVIAANSKPNQYVSLGLNASVGAEEIINKTVNISVQSDPVAITEAMLTKGINVNLYVYDLYGTAWNPNEPADGVLFSVEFKKPFSKADWVVGDKGKATVEYDEEEGWMVSKISGASQVVYEINKTAISNAINEGNDRMTVVLDTGFSTDFNSANTVHVFTVVDKNGSGYNIHNTFASQYKGWDSVTNTLTLVVDLVNSGYKFDQKGLTVYLGVNDVGGKEVTGEKIKSITFDKAPVFDINDHNMWLDTAATYTYSGGTFTIGDMNIGGKTIITLVPDVINNYYEQGFGKMKFTFASKADQFLTFGVNGASGNKAVALGPVAITEAMLTDGYKMEVYTTDQYGTAWNPKDPADGCTLKIEWIKEFDADNPATYVSADSAVTYSDGTYVFTLDLNPDGTVNNKITISADYIKYLAEQGKTSIKLDFKSKDGQKVFFDAWGSGGRIKMQNLACNLDAVTITDDMKTNGYTVTIAAKDIGKDWGGTEDADGYILTITVA